MTALSQTLDQVCVLLGDLPGVAIVRSELHGGSARIEIVASDAATVDTLQRMSLGANVALEPRIRLSDEAGLDSLPAKYVLVASTAHRDRVEFGELQLLGIHLVWHLHKIGLLATPRADALLHKWHGAAVGA